MDSARLLCAGRCGGAAAGGVSDFPAGPLVSLAMDEHLDRHLRRWKECRPDEGLTWGRPLTGDAFVKLAREHGVFGVDKDVLELGPGYGRLPIAMLGLSVAFRSYSGVDLSPKNLAVLREQSAGLPNIEFIEGAFADVQLPGTYDAVLSSLVLKHQHPTFHDALQNIARFCRAGCVFFFDLIENEAGLDEPVDRETLLRKGPALSRWESGNDTYVASYSRAEVQTLLDALGLHFVTFDRVYHAEGADQRLVVVARKS